MINLHILIFPLIYTYVNLDHQTSHKGQYFETEILSKLNK